jgi:hypothetical protein
MAITRLVCLIERYGSHFVNTMTMTMAIAQINRLQAYYCTRSSSSNLFRPQISDPYKS